MGLQVFCLQVPIFGASEVTGQSDPVGFKPARVDKSDIGHILLSID